MRRKRAPGPGRKPKGEFKGKLATFSTRITPDLRKKLDRAALESGRSVSQEAERRLTSSFYDGGSSDDPAAEALCFTIGLLARSARFNRQMTWQTHPFLHQAFKLALSKWLDRLAPTKDPSLPEPEQFTAEQFATMIELALWNKVQTVDLPDIGVPGPFAKLVYKMSNVRGDLNIPFDDSSSNFFASKEWMRGKKA
jgi:hypothetical protein